MGEKRSYGALVVGLLVLSWYATSSAGSVIAKALLSEFPYPVSMSLVHLLTISLLTEPFFDLLGVSRPASSWIGWPSYLRQVVPLAFLKFLGNLLGHVSILNVPVSYAHTVKATMPLFAVVLSRLILGERQTQEVYYSLLPIVTGVAVASLTELSFNLTGLLSALASTMILTILNIYSKKVLNETGINEFRLLSILGRLSLLMFLPIWFVYDGYSFFDPNSSSEIKFSARTMFLIVLNGLLIWAQNVIVFAIISVASSLTYSVANAFKRVFVIGVSLLVLGNPVSKMNILGMILATIGVFMYNKAKFDLRVKKVSKQNGVNRIQESNKKTS